MRERDIVAADVEAVLDRPDSITPSRRNPRVRKFRKSVGGRRLTVVVGPDWFGGQCVLTVFGDDEED